jgi:hypothetical protein
MPRGRAQTPMFCNGDQISQLIKFHRDFLSGGSDRA